MPSRTRVVAIIAAYNEADIIGQVVRVLIDDGIQVYFLDNRSTDGTMAAVRRYLKRGVIGVETFPPDARSGEAATFQWEQILRRKEELAQTLDADWFIHHDADEFRESPWHGETLREGIQRVDAAGYDAIDFHVVNFWPTNADGRGKDVRDRLRHCEPGRVFDRLQIKCWKKTPQPVALAASGGHSAEFAGRRIFPIRFLLRHYPIRSQAHGERKVFEERVARFDESERARGWHVQYDDIRKDASFVRDAATLTLYDPDAVRLEVLTNNRVVERLERALEATQDLADRLSADTAPLHQHMQRQDEELGRLRPERDELLTNLNALRKHLAEQDDELARLRPERGELLVSAATLRQHLAEQDDEVTRLRPERDELLASAATLRQHLAEQDDEVTRLRAERERSLAEFDSLERHLATQDAELERLRAERQDQITAQEKLHAHLAAQDAELGQLRETHQRLTAEHAGLAKHLASQDAELDQLRQTSQRLAADHAALAAHLATQDTELSGLRAERASLLDERGRLIDEREQSAVEHARLTSRAKDQDTELAGLRTERADFLEERDRQDRDHARMREELALADGYRQRQAEVIESLRHERDQLQRLSNELAEALARSEATLARVMGSASWRVTAPLRFVDRLVRKT